jgi:hydrogenase-4 component B
MTAETEAVFEGVHVAYSAIPAVITLAPIAAAALVRPIGKRSESARNAYVVLVTALTLIGAVALIPVVGASHWVGCTVPLMLGGLVFTVDSFGMLFALFTGLLWFCSTLYSLDYLKHEQKRDRYHTVSLIVLGSMMGVVTAGDLMTLYLFFEALGLVAFFFVIHTETDDAKAAAIKYFWMTVVGGFALVGGILIVMSFGGTGVIGPVPAPEGMETLRWAAALLMVLGFGVKAGMLPVHVWLPDAHPVAPSPASALLSGVMIKAGAYGIFRVVTTMFRPEYGVHIEESLWEFTAELGLVVFWIGIATMFIGVFMALLQSNAKRMLAYHSVSQMGFIITAFGAAGYLGPEMAMGVAGGVYHSVNHALFKGALFLGVGAVFFRTGQLDMYKLGGLWRKMPLTFLFVLLAAFGITGVPLFNGFVSKCLIHHSIVEAFELHELASLAVAEKIFMVTCGGTACSFIKLIYLVFLGKAKTEYGPEVKDAPPRMLVSMGLLAVAITVLGVRPDLILRGVVEPGLEAMGLEVATVEHYLEVYFLSPSDLMSFVIAFAIGVVIFAVGMKTGLFHAHFPVWMSIDWYYERFVVHAGRAFVAIDDSYERWRAAVSRSLRWVNVRYHSGWSQSSRVRERFVTTVLTGAPGPRNQHLVQHAYVALERERQATVRYAVSSALHQAEEAGVTAGPDLRERIDAVRDIAAYMAKRLFTERLGVVSDFIATGRGDEIGAVFDGAVPTLAASRGEVAGTAVLLAGRRMAGENVLREISAEVNRVLSRERFDQTLLRALPVRYAQTSYALASGQRLRRAIRDTDVLVHYRAEGLSWLERASKWLMDVIRISVNAVTRERAEWMEQGVLEEATIVATRGRIQRYARDMSFNVAMIMIVLLVFIAALLVGR